MKTSVILTAMALVAAAPLVAQEKTEGRKLAELAFDSVDVNGRGYVDQGDMDDFGEDIRYSMDANDDGKITLDEWMGWDFGYSVLAEELGKGLAPQIDSRIRIGHGMGDNERAGVKPRRGSGAGR